MVIAFLNLKGGTGKTTLAAHVAWQLAQDDDNVLLLDADPQKSASDWAALRDDTPFTVVAVARPNLHTEVARLRSRFAHVVIDGPPRGDGLLRSCLAGCDLCAIPIEPSGLSVRAADRILDMIDEVRTFRPELDARFVVSRKIAGTVIGRELRDLAAGPPVLASEVTQRVAFAVAMTYGQTIAEREGDAHPGAGEIASLTDELLRIEQQELIA